MEMTSKTLICYGTRYGTTTEIVEEMAKAAREAGAEVDVIELEKKLPTLALDEYGLIIIGSGIQAGSWKKEPLEFIRENLDALSKSRVALFVVCGDAGNPERCDAAQAEYLDAVVSSYPSLEPVSTGLFGGMFDFKRYNFVVRALVKRIVKSRSPPGEEVPEKLDFRDWDKIREWILELHLAD
ncbi:nitric oxide synthase [Candidatus Thorarchaeota archaeon]|jgi:menaquinone-dependent protoporphyrinogen oxidase|nr:MAG: nitric oxide synthase [Candidatus Thorarchaeota archaeon]